MAERGRARILLVEDDEDQQVTLAALLEQHDVRITATLAEARRALAEGVCDVLLLDLNLPDGRGSSLLPAPGDPVVVLISGEAEPPEAGPAWAARRFRIAYKPYDPAMLLHFVETAIRLRRLRQRPTPPRGTPRQGS